MVVVGRPHTFLYLFLTASGVSFVIGGPLLQVSDNLGEAVLRSRITDVPALVNRQATPCPTTTTRKTTTSTCTTINTCTTTTSTGTQNGAADSTLTLTRTVVSSTPVTTTVVSSGSGDKGQILVGTTFSRTNSRSSDSQTTTQMAQLAKTSQQPSANPTTLSSSTAVESSTAVTTAKLGALSMKAAYIGIALGIVLALLLILGVVLLLRRRRSKAKNLNSASRATGPTNVTPYNIPPPSSPTAVPAHNYDLEKPMVSTQQAPATGNGDYQIQTSAAATLATSTFTPVGEGNVTGQSAINQRIRVVRAEMMHLQAKLPSEEPLARRAIRLADENGTTEGVADAELTMEKMQEMMVRLQDQVSRLQRQQQANWAARLSVEPPPDYERGQDTSTEGESKTEVL